MEFQFRIQDPSNPSTIYILEEIIQLVRRGDLKKWRGIYSWTTGKTLSKVFLEDPDVNLFMQNGQVEFLIGLDAITTDYALTRLLEIGSDYEGFNSKVFHNDVSDLFHPKISHFEFSNDEHILLVGSGNFTLTGLQTNIEAYTITTGSLEELKSISIWDDFIQYHKERIHEIDEKALEIARKNRAWFRRKKKEPLIPEEEIIIESLEEDQEESEEIIDARVKSRLTDESRVLIAFVPAAGNRWRQIHYNSAVIKQFFQAEANSHQRIFLKEIRLDGTIGPDEVRPVIYSFSNKNYKIEVSTRLDKNYPSEGKPIIVLREVGVRNFLYMLILPDDEPHSYLQGFLDQNESIGKGLKRVITKSGTLKSIWDNCPLITTD